MADYYDSYVLNKIEIVETRAIQVRYVRRTYRDDVVIAEEYHRRAYDPGMDMSHEHPEVQAYAAIAWTPEVLSAHRARVKAQEL